MRNEVRCFARHGFVVALFGAALALAGARSGRAQGLPDCDGDPGDPPAGSQAWQDRDTANQICATRRMIDEYSNPAMGIKFQQETARTYTDDVIGQAFDPARPRVTLAQWIPGGETADPYRVPSDWATAPLSRGRVADVSFIASDGAKLLGRVFRPKGNGPFPSIVITTGSIQGYQELYNWAAEGLAEAGYLVLTYDVQGQGRSETLPHNPDGTPACDANGCAGVPFQQNYNFFQGTEDALNFLFSTPSAPYSDGTEPNVAGTNTFNPFWDDVDVDHVGLAGHSLGASAVSVVGQEDSRVKAIVAWDALAKVSNADLPLVHAPALSLASEYFFNPSPMSSPPNPDDCSTGSGGGPSGCKADAFGQLAGLVDTMLVFLRSSTHLEYSYVPYILPASRHGERVAMYYTRAWFDAYLHPSAAVNAAGASRLVAATFDDSADASSIGAGTYDAAANANVPNLIAGNRVHDRLSFYYRSRYSLDGGAKTCADMRAGCS